MLERRLRLKSVADPVSGAKLLTDVVMRGGNVTSSSSDIVAIRDAYLSWVEQVENVLRGLSHDSAPVTELFTSHYWRIRAIESDPRWVSDPRAWQLIDSEVRRQLDRLGLLLTDLNARLAALTSRGAHLVLLDTNVLMHYQPIDQIPWPEVLSLTPIRLVIPLRVIEEIDAKKYARRDEFAQRARDLLPALERMLGPSGQPGRLTNAVTVEVPVDVGPRYRPDDADEEILETCREVAQFSRQAVKLITDDTGIRLRAQAIGVTALRPPSNYRR